LGLGYTLVLYVYDMLNRILGLMIIGGVNDGVLNGKSNVASLLGSSASSRICRVVGVSFMVSVGCVCFFSLFLLGVSYISLFRGACFAFVLLPFLESCFLGLSVLVVLPTLVTLGLLASTWLSFSRACLRNVSFACRSFSSFLYSCVFMISLWFCLYVSDMIGT
jgi:hypothetical protein